MGETEFLVKLRDAATMIADAAQERLEKLAPANTKQGARATENPPDLSMIIWKPTTGPKGAFEIAESKANANNAPFARLTEYLNSHDGKATLSGFFVWKFTDGSGSVGRKPTKK